VTRALRIVTHNWPLKVGAIALASLLYGGLVLSQTTQPFIGSVPIQIVNQPADVIVLSNPGAVTRIDYVAPQDLGLRIDSTSFRATVDLNDVEPTGQPQTLNVAVEGVDPRIQVLSFEPRRISLILDKVASKTVPIEAVLLPIPSGLDVGEPVLDATTATVSGPQSIVSQVAAVEARIAIDASGIDVNQMIDLLPVDAAGETFAARLDVDPPQVRVKVPVFSDVRSKSLPVNPVVTGTPAAGFEVESVTVDPPVVSVEGDANDLAALDRADTESISVSGASSDLTRTVGLALPDGVQAPGGTTVDVTIRLRPVTATRTFEAGITLVGAQPDKRYQLSTDRVIVTIGGSVADLDRLSTTSFTMRVDVGGLGDGTHTVPVEANLNAGLTLVGVSPNPIQVTVSTPAAPATPPAASPAPSPTA
jgi:YbbR domain-containing protein